MKAVAYFTKKQEDPDPKLTAALLKTKAELLEDIKNTFVAGTDFDAFFVALKTLGWRIDLWHLQNALCKITLQDGASLEKYALDDPVLTEEKIKIYGKFFRLIGKHEVWEDLKSRHEKSSLKKLQGSLPYPSYATLTKQTDPRPAAISREPFLTTSTWLGLFAGLIIVSLLYAVAQHPDGEGLKRELNQAAHAFGRFLFGLDEFKVDMDDPRHSHIAVSTLLSFGGSLITGISGGIGARLARKPG